MQVGDLVKRKPEWESWVEHNPWMYTEKDLEVGIIINISKEGYWDYDVLWAGNYVETLDESELEKADVKLPPSPL